MNIMLLFLSTYNGKDGKEGDNYITDFGIVTGKQTNEAPVKYALERLKKEKLTLDKIIALVTPKAKDSALTQFSETVKSVSPNTDILPLEIPDNVTTVELLSAVISELSSLNRDDNVIIETTGGYRKDVTKLTLISRFLRYRGIEVKFSTYADYVAKSVTDTSETDELWELLDAVNLFAVSGNPVALSKSLVSVRGIPEKPALIKAMRDFYDMLLCCKVSKLDKTIENLRNAFDGIINADIPPTDTKTIVFRDMVREIILSKMEFIREKDYFRAFILWLLDNNYIQQAVTILWEKILWKKIEDNKHRRNYKPGSVSEANWLKSRLYRNNFNHADGEDLDELKDSADKVKEFLKLVTENYKYSEPN
ncbi:hypothetical protein AGMMS49975_08130 [Clostridia bacterium]|nr:hypothetical protein AGMMS49975_08130 [Clostridia bacterium]